MADQRIQNTEEMVGADHPTKSDALNRLALVEHHNDGTDIPLLLGYLRRAKFRWKDADEIYVGPGQYDHRGTTNQIVTWISELTFHFSSGGSNAASDDLGINEWHYLYLDDSAIVTAGKTVITATGLQNNTTAPTWSHTKQGWYNGNDRCIGAFRTGASANILEFFHSGDLIMKADRTTDYNAGTPSNLWAYATLTVPGFCTRAFVTFYGLYIDTAAHILWRTSGQSGTVGHRAGSVGATGIYTEQAQPVITDSTQKIEVCFSAATADNMLSVFTDGWFFPEGM